MERLLLALFAGVLVSIWMERWKRPVPAAIAVHAGIVIVVFLVLSALCQRPYLASGLALALHRLVIVVNDAKWRALHEPLLFSDYGLYSQALRHPRLYLPYLHPLPTLMAALAFVAVLAVSLMLEVSGISGLGWLLLLPVGVGMIWSGTRRAQPILTLEPGRDVVRLGLIASSWLYWLLERGPIEAVSAPAPVVRAPARRPDIVVIECESFFDARRIRPGVPDDVLRRFDLLCAEGTSGRLTVPSWGGNTMRTEFAFLSGIAPAKLGVHRFNPYRRFALRPVPTIASRLRALGYRTVCVHPYPATFFGRDRVFPQLGFDEFVDLSAFDGAPRDGQYVADAAVALKIGETLRRLEQPTFVFAITMENHGPQYLEAGPGGDELAVYLRHLRNSDAMIGEVADALRSRSREGVLCAFGDHVPSLPAVFASAQFEDPRTEYLIRAHDGAPGGRDDLCVEVLGDRILRAAGLENQA